MPTELARGPWDPGALHGGAPGALMASAIEATAPGVELFVSRLTFEFLRPVPLAPLELETSVIRPGRRAQLVEARLSSGGVAVARCVGLRTVTAPSDLHSDLDAEQEERVPPGPEEGRPIRFSLAPDDTVGFAGTAMQMRFVAGDDGLGPATVWMRLAYPLIDDQPPSALARAVAAADFGNGVSAVLDFEQYIFINPDLTVYLYRHPHGEWVCLRSSTHIQAGAGAMSHSDLYDARGAIGRSAQSLVVATR